jgi:hypothetical protein
MTCLDKQGTGSLHGVLSIIGWQLSASFVTLESRLGEKRRIAQVLGNHDGNMEEWLYTALLLLLTILIVVSLSTRVITVIPGKGSVGLSVCPSVRYVPYILYCNSAESRRYGVHCYHE